MTTGRLPAVGTAPLSIAEIRPDAPPRLIDLIESLLETDGDDPDAKLHMAIAELVAIEQAFAQLGMNQIGYDRSLVGSREQRAAFSFASSPIQATPQHASASTMPAKVQSRQQRRNNRRWFAVAGLLLVVAAGWFGNREWRKATLKQEVASLCEQSEAACRHGSYREAISLAERAIEKNPKHALAYARRARVKFFLGDEHGTLDDCDEALRHDSNLAIALAYRAPVAWLKHPAKEGVENAERALELNPELPEGPACLAVAKLQTGDVSGAESVATAAIANGNSDPETHRACGLVRLAKGDATALADFHAAIKQSGNQPFYLVARSEYYTARSAMLPLDKEGPMLALALADADAALAQSDLYGIALVAKARVLAAKGRFPDANRLCEQAVAANPHLVATYLRGADALSPRQARRYQILQDALMYEVDLRGLKGGGDFAFGSLHRYPRLVCRRISMTPYIDWWIVLPEARQTLRCETQPQHFDGRERREFTNPCQFQVAIETCVAKSARRFG